MVRLYHYSIALLSAVAIASTSSSDQDVDIEIHPSDTLKTAGPAPSIDDVNVEKVASWEVHPDGSAIAHEKKTPSAPSAKAQILRDKSGKWIVVPYGEANSLDPSPSLQEEEQVEKVETIENVDEETKSSFKGFSTPSKSFMALKARIAKEGHTSELINELVRIATTYEDPEEQRKGNDWVFAVAHRSVKQLFEPNSAMKDDNVFIDAIYNLKIAADHGAQTARAIMGMLDVIGVPDPDELEDPNVPPLSREARRAKGDDTLQALAFRNDSIAMLAVAYGTLSGRISVPTTDHERRADADAMCEAALTLYRKCADRSVKAIVAEGSEQIERLSSKPRSSGFWDVLGFGGSSYESHVSKSIEHYLTIANDPLDAQYTRAMQDLGDLYFSGNPAAHVKPDPRLAAQYYRRAAEAGDLGAQATYGTILATGMGVEQDYTQARARISQTRGKDEQFVCALQSWQALLSWTWRASERHPRCRTLE